MGGPLLAQALPRALSNWTSGAFRAFAFRAFDAVYCYQGHCQTAQLARFARLVRCIVTKGTGKLDQWSVALLPKPLPNWTGGAFRALRYLGFCVFGCCDIGCCDFC